MAKSETHKYARNGQILHLRFPNQTSFYITEVWMNNNNKIIIKRT